MDEDIYVYKAKKKTSCCTISILNIYPKQIKITKISVTQPTAHLNN